MKWRPLPAELARLLRVLVCALAPGWHPGFQRTQIGTSNLRVSAGAYSVTPGMRVPGAPARVWAVARCIRCREPEVW
jgi:hypothetical protein